ncbi:MAG: hypothetical protein JW797_13965 [Bradymonadales bacterium]|nr:hypothetical protein [Bradymonadales bacterium]
MNKLVFWIGLLTLGFCVTACCSENGSDIGDPYDQMDTRWLVPATDGGDGGAGGALQIYYTNWSSEMGPEDLDDVLVLNGGLMGDGGQGMNGESGVAGLAGLDGSCEVLQSSNLLFDATDIEQDMVINVGVPGEIDTLSLVDTASPTVITVDSLHVGSQGSLVFTCDIRIRARELIVDAGGTLAFRQRDGQDCLIGLGGAQPPILGQPGLAGGLALVDTELLDLAGTLDLSGNDGATGEKGGEGGSLVILAEEIQIRSGAQILMRGGRGGDGLDEQDLSR